MRSSERKGAGAPAGATARAAAADAVAKVVRDGLALDAALAGAPSLPERDAALVKALAYGACRWHHRLEWQASQLLARPLVPREARLAALLRIGLFQLQATRVPEHAAVSATVDAARLIGAPRAGGLVNAVLRRFLRERTDLEARMQALPEPLHAHPAWLIAALRSDWPEDWREILAANNATPPMWLRVNARRTSRDAYLAKLRAAGIEAAPSPSVPSAVLLAEPRPTSSLPGYSDGEVSVQDLAAQLAPDWLAVEPGQRVLDACAAPGGKTAHILERCRDIAELVAVDRDAARLATVAAGLRRLELDARLIEADATRPELWWDGVPFDRVLLDAPCSALGVVRRHPDIKILRTPGDVERVAALQGRLLAALWPLVRPGGRLVYATCTVLHRENRDQVAAFVGAVPDAVLLAAAQRKPGEADGDGFYYACMQKQESAPPFRVFDREE